MIAAFPHPGYHRPALQPCARFGWVGFISPTWEHQMAEPFLFRFMATLGAGVILLGLGACATYDPLTGQSYYDPGATMAAVGTAAFVGSVAASSYREPPRSYHRPYYHHHYNRPRPPSHRPPSHRPPSHRPPSHRPPSHRPPSHRPSGNRPSGNRPPRVRR